MKQRYYLLDAFRGASMIAVIIYHVFWDLANVVCLPMPWFESATAFAIQRTLRWCFVFLAGFCCAMGKHPVKRGLVLLGCSWVVTLVTTWTGSPVVFGVLTFLGSATLISALWRKLLRDRVFPVWVSCLGLGLCLVCFILTNRLETGYLLDRAMPGSLYANDFTAYLGFPPISFRSEDYVPLIPWLFAYGTGYWCYQIFARCHWMGIFTKGRIRALEYIGRHSLFFYLVHQPLIYGIIWML